MALISFPSRHHILVHRSSPVAKPICKPLKLKHCQFLLKKEPSSTTLVARSSLRNEVFENRSEGIICYTDDKGEIICEGYDEGPRFLQRLSRTSYHTRDAEIVNLIQQRLLQIVNGGESNNTDTDAVNYSLQDDLNFNGFHRICSSSN